MATVLTKSDGPMHVHLSDDASLHVHILEKDKLDNSEQQLRKANNINGRISKRKPWIPPPARTSKNYQSLTEDPDGIAEETQLARTCRYEAKIQSLLSQLEALKDERNARKNFHLLHESQVALQEQALELDDYKERLDTTTRQLEILQDTIDRLTDTADTTASASLRKLNDSLLRCLIECELACEAVMSGVHNYTRSSQAPSASSHLNNFRDTLEQRVRDLESVSGRLCQLLRSRASRCLDASRWNKEREDWQTKVQELEDLNAQWRSECAKKEREFNELEMRLHRYKEEDVSVTNMRHNMEVSRRHVEERLEQKRRECDKLRDCLAKQEAHSSRLEYDLEQVRRDLERHLAQQQASLEQEESIGNLKEALRRREKQLKSIEEAVQDRDFTLDTYQQEVERLESKLRQSDGERQRLAAIEEDLKSQLESLKQSFNLVELNLQRKSEDLQSLTVEKNVDFMAVQEENQRLRHLLNQCEVRLTDVDGEMTELRDSLRHYEQLVMDYRGKEDRNESKWKDRLERAQLELQDSRQTADRLRVQFDSSERHKQDLLTRLSTLEGELSTMRHRCEDLQHENNARRVQLEESLVKEKRFEDKQRSRESVVHREHQSSLQELEAEIARLRAENKRIVFECEEQQRHHLSRVQDLKIQLEQADITSRSMQTYVNFLKRSYANVFGRHVNMPGSYFEPATVNVNAHTAASSPMQFDPTFGSFGSLFPSPSVSIS